MAYPIIDIHCHPNIRPYGWSLKNKDFFNPSDKSSPWFSSTATEEDLGRVMEGLTTFAPYRQCDFKNLAQGMVKISFLSFYPLEQGFTRPKNVNQQLTPELVGKIIGLGPERARQVMASNYNYWYHYLWEYEYFSQLDGNKNAPTKVRFLKPGDPMPDFFVDDTVWLVSTIEGGHTLCDGCNTLGEQEWANVEVRVQHLKQQPIPPFFITMAHHFLNGITTHCESLPQTLFDQVRGMDKKDDFGEGAGPVWISKRGYKVLNAMLDTKNGRRIHVDVKHMAREARLEFYNWRKQHYGDAPIIYSHGAGRGTGYSDKSVKFYDRDINLDETDVIEIVSSNGIIGLEMDQRIMGMNELTGLQRKWRAAKLALMSKRKKEMFWAEPVMHNILWIVEVIERYNRSKGSNLNAWEHISLGTDFDGIINPLNQYWEASRLPSMREALRTLLHDYFNGRNRTVTPQDTDGVLDKIFYSNALRFLQQYYL
ncbi:MAG: membrane dipeptidase [Bacteroidia bacterium]|nr:membrane dipeptidase [Bacteroidia bacterium]